MRPSSFFVGTVCAFLGGCCASVSPPASQVPDAKSAVARLDATYANVSGVQGSAKIDYLGGNGRVRGELQILATSPASMLMGITANVIGGAGMVASDGVRFVAEDKANNRFLVGPAKPCNIARITQVPLPSEELVPMLWGMRPQILGPVVADSISWSGEGYYVVTIRENSPGTLAHELHIAPHPDDWQKPWSEQRMRLAGVLGWSGTGVDDASLVYRVTMAKFVLSHTAKPFISDDPALEDDAYPSGPNVDADVPSLIHVEVPSKKSDVIFKYDEGVVLNPPLRGDVFHLKLTPGIPVEESNCD